MAGTPEGLLSSASYPVMFERLPSVMKIFQPWEHLTCTYCESHGDSLFLSFGFPHTALGRYSQPDPELMNESSLLLLSSSGMGLVGYIFLTLYVGGSVGGLLNSRHPRGVIIFHVQLIFHSHIHGASNVWVAHIQSSGRHPREVIIFVTLYVGGSVGGLLMAGTPEG